MAMMNIEASKLIHFPVAAEDTLSKVGLVSKIIIEPENGQVLGFLVATGFFRPALALSTMDIKFWDLNGLVIDSEENLVEPSEIVRLKTALDKNIDLFDLPAVTESGKSLGSVEDFLIDTETASIVKYYLRDLLNHARVMDAEKVLRIDKTIVFTDDEGVIRDSGLTETSAA